MEDTIAILRGLKERYEVHHGVRIKDSAIIAAATLSNRYISDRFLPDKAVDLIDEAASRLRIELDSMPAEIDVIDRKIIQLEIEKPVAEKGNGPDLRGADGTRSIRNWRNSGKRMDRMKLPLDCEKEAIKKIQAIKEQIETLKDGRTERAAGRQPGPGGGNPLREACRT